MDLLLGQAKGRGRNGRGGEGLFFSVHFSLATAMGLRGEYFSQVGASVCESMT